MATLQELQTELNSIPAGDERNRSARANELRREIAKLEAQGLKSTKSIRKHNTT